MEWQGFRRWGWAVVALLGSCVEQAPLDPPTFTSALLLIDGDGVAPELHAVDGGALPPLTVPFGATVTLLGYDAPLSSFGLVAGPVAITESPPGRPIPTPAFAEQISAPNREWVGLAWPDPRFDAWGLPAPESCEDDRSCRYFVEGETICEKPCAVTEPTLPDPPAAPADLDFRDCPPSWQQDPGCAPPPDETCTEGQIIDFESRRCVPLVACPSGAFRSYDGPLQRVLYVDPSASSPGEGTEASPYASLDLALMGAPTGGFVASLAAGRYPLPVDLPDGLVLFGACPSRVELIGPLSVTAGRRLELDGVRLSGAAEVSGTLVAARAQLGGGQDGLSLFEGAHLELDRARVAADRYALRTAATTRVQLRDAVLAAPQGAFFTGTASVSLHRVELRSSARSLWMDDAVSVDWTLGRLTGSGSGSMAWLQGDAALRARGLDLDGARGFYLADASALDLRGGWHRAASRTLRCTGTARPVIRELVAEAAETNPLVLTEDRCVALVERPRAQGAGGTFVRATGTSSVSVRDGQISGFSHGAVAWDAAALALTRVDIDPITVGQFSGSGSLSLFGHSPCFDRNAPSEGGLATGAFTDVVVHGGRLRPALATCASAQSTGERVRAIGGFAGVFADCRDGCAERSEVAYVDLSDIEIRGTEDTRAGLVHRTGVLSVHRARIADVLEYGAYVWGTTATLSDVTISGVNPASTVVDRLGYCDQNRSETERAPASGLFVEGYSVRGQVGATYARANLDRFHISGSHCGGIASGALSAFHATRGTLEDNYRGLNLLRGVGPNTWDETVRFRGAEQIDIYDLEPK